MKSWSARYLAVRRVTQDNRGKNTAGIDGVASLPPSERQDLVATLNRPAKAQPVRRVWIPKPGKPEKRPLGIPTMRDRAAQTLVRLALEPEWERRFEPHSYGFRPGRSTHDAIGAIYTAIKLKPKYVLDADIAACFDRIDQAALVQKLNTFPALRRVIHGWLKAGVWDGVELKPTEEGTPQGGALSPLLANIALHGLETAVTAAFPAKRPRRFGSPRPNWKPVVVRYADDFVVLHEDLAVIEQVRNIVAAWLASVGLELKPSKTRISHTLVPHDGNLGFDFLGFHVRQYPKGYHRTGKVRLGFKTLITPSQDGQKRHGLKLAEIVRHHRALPQEALIAALNPLIVGWCNYYSAVVAKRTFSRMHNLLYGKLKRWAKRRHPRKSAHWASDRYWHQMGSRKWVFGTKDGIVLVNHQDTRIVRHELVRGHASPYDGNLLYWATRLGRHPELTRTRAYLLKRQQGRCAGCGLLFTHLDELVEVDHRVPRSRGGTDAARNRKLLHGHCHDSKTAADGSNRRSTARYP
jgi:RNA-directed DNA polymerase